MSLLQLSNMPFAFVPHVHPADGCIEEMKLGCSWMKVLLHMLCLDYAARSDRRRTPSCRLPLKVRSPGKPVVCIGHERAADACIEEMKLGCC